MDKTRSVLQKEIKIDKNGIKKVVKITQKWTKQGRFYKMKSKLIKAELKNGQNKANSTNETGWIRPTV